MLMNGIQLIIELVHSVQTLAVSLNVNQKRCNLLLFTSKLAKLNIAKKFDSILFVSDRKLSAKIKFDAPPL